MKSDRMPCAYLADLVGELSGLLVVNLVGVKQGAEGPEVGLLLQQRDKVVRVAAEAGRDDLPDLPFHVVRLEERGDMYDVNTFLIT